MQITIPRMHFSARSSLVWISMLGLVCSCAVTQPRSTPARVEGELFYDPAPLTSPQFDPSGVRLWGVKLGDPVSVIPASRIRTEGAQGWIWCRDGSRYRIQEGVVVALGLWNQESISRLNIASPTDIEARFGKTTTIDQADPLRIYRYHGGKLAVVWNDREKLVNAINISR